MFGECADGKFDRFKWAEIETPIEQGATLKTISD